MRYELARRLATIVRTLAELGESDNSRALGRRLTMGLDVAIAWLGGEYGKHVWAEIGAVASFAKRYANHLPSDQGTAARLLEHAFGEAECLLVDEPTPAPRAATVVMVVPRPAALPAEELRSIERRLEVQATELARPTLRVIPGGAVRLVERDSNPPKRAA